MKVVIRSDASLQIGTGHIMRCLTLANALKKQNAEIAFICREHQGHLIEKIRSQGFKVHALPCMNGSSESQKDKNAKHLFHEDWLGATQEQDAKQCKTILERINPDWLIVDHYAIDSNWEGLLKTTYKKLMVIDDLADIEHLCDLLLDQTYGRQILDYQALVPEACQMLLGSKYTLLRPEFAHWREFSLKRRVHPEFKKLLITMGGVDSDNVTGQVLEAIRACQLPDGMHITVVMGETAPHIDLIKRQVETMPYKTQVLVNVNNMAEIMANTDFAIGAAGATTWERCCLGLPSATVMLAENQRDIANLLARLNVAVVLDKRSLQSDIKVLETISVEMLSTLSQNSLKILDEQGVNRVIESMRTECL